MQQMMWVPPGGLIKKHAAQYTVCKDCKDLRESNSTIRKNE